MYRMVTETTFTLGYLHSFCGVPQCTCISPLGGHYRLSQPAISRRYITTVLQTRVDLWEYILSHMLDNSLQVYK